MSAHQLSPRRFLPVRPRGRRALTAALIAVGIALGMAALVLLGRYAPSLADFGRRHALILAMNGIAAGVLLLVIAVSLARLLSDYRRKVPGALLRGRLVATFAGLSLVPLAVVYVFALRILTSGIDNWFESDLEASLSRALEYSRQSLDVQARSRLAQTATLARVVGDLDGDALSRALGVLRTDAGADEIAVFGPDARLRSFAAETPGLLPVIGEEARAEVRRNGQYVILESEVGNRYQVRAVVRMPGGDSRYLQAVYPVSERQSGLVGAVQETYSRFSELKFLRDPLMASLTLTLSLVLLLSLLAAVGGAILMARRLVAPIQSLVSGTEAVAKGDLDTQLPAGRNDEIGFLIQSFNDMIRRLAKAREDNRRGQQQLERERGNLAAILGRLSTGVVALDPAGRLRIANDAASAILGVGLSDRAGATLAAIGADAPLVAQFHAACQATVAEHGDDWRGQIELHTDSSRRILNCASTRLVAGGDEPGGSIIVFDDVTELLLAQREAAWGEVARRLAHEIKNPLTPIQLAAERIRRRYLPALAGDDAQILDRSTHTIVQQVEAMRDMVNAFSDYARSPEVNLAAIDLNQLVREVAWLYRGQDGQSGVRLELAEEVGAVNADAIRVRQLLHNLIRNAQEATEGQPDALITITTRLQSDAGRPSAELVVSDNGPGIPADTLPRIFEPYVTTKKKGTGLGLAIVKKLVEEHGGSVRAENRPVRGAQIVLSLPLLGESASETDARGPAADRRRERA